MHYILYSIHFPSVWQINLNTCPIYLFYFIVDTMALILSDRNAYPAEAQIFRSNNIQTTPSIKFDLQN